ncbi:hypothetical protein ARMGADRAFT_591679 [Armillaria gallica]|uniref:Uncharacterized protein n=1 Tax=Armillaria gallica TaxID=47427 RepID=A0A2H3CPV1_ARMGA|nr:hypothetical protein ARMGADRAFT_591679 [Armillaria gallica]
MARPTTSTSSDNLLVMAAATFCAETTDHIPASEGGELGSPCMECLGGRFVLLKTPGPSLCFDGFPFTKASTIMMCPAMESGFAMRRRIAVRRARVESCAWVVWGAVWLCCRISALNSSAAFRSPRPPSSHWELHSNGALRRRDVSSSCEHTQQGLRMTGKEDDAPITQGPRLSALGLQCMPFRVSSLPSETQAQALKLKTGGVLGDRLISGAHESARGLLSHPDEESNSRRLCSPPSNPSRLIE